jgi:hypothetical protein
VKKASDEFLFLRDKLEKIARMLIDGTPEMIREASFSVGCLHNICHDNITRFINEKEVK